MAVARTLVAREPEAVISRQRTQSIHRLSSSPKTTRASYGSGRTTVKNQREHGTVVAPLNIEQIAEAMEPRAPLSSSPAMNKTQPQVAEDKPAVKRKMPWAGKGQKKVVEERPPNCYSYSGSGKNPRIVYLRRPYEVDALVRGLKGPLGFDMEWKVFHGYKQAKTALVQICDAQTILLIQLSAIKVFPKSLKDQARGEYNQLSHSIDARRHSHREALLDDGHKLLRDFEVHCEGLTDLTDLARQADPDFKYKGRLMSLAKIVEKYTEKTLWKGSERMSNWELVLSSKQQEYAANDAYCALEVHDILKKIASENDIAFDPSSIARAVPQGTPLGPTPSNASLNSTASFTSTASSTTTLTEAPVIEMPPRRPTKQQLRAYNMWHHMDMSLPDMCKSLRSEDDPLKESTVIGYVVEALKADKTLPFNKEALKTLLDCDPFMVKRYERWIASLA
ncbi:ribonuclease H-like protein [Sistotremastrum niveocremeum HHB9708]|uniref:3'-5' exonuclease n=1 Tax=Sistotremastrum niveocremeum HHB9708 TaxID=1314777 RepID=A0A164YBI7_9AGAM|nr:ribonuclease H-like protein [Sistotremastrum niveocremeum HHB9708]